MKKLVIPFVAVAVFAVSSCTHPSTWTQEQKTAATGAAIGGVAGAIIGKQSGETTKGAVTGAAVGGAGGYLYGQQQNR